MSPSQSWYDQVKGLPRTAVEARHPDAPKPLTLSWCEEHLWWWRSLGKGHLPRHIGPAQWPLLRLMHKLGAMEEWLLACGEQEWKARVNGTELPPVSPMTFWNDYNARGMQRYTLDGLKITELHSAAEVTEMVLSHLKAQGWKSGKGVFQRDRRVSGMDSWASMFSAIELADRHYLLGQSLVRDPRRTEFAKDPDRIVTARLNREALPIDATWSEAVLVGKKSGKVIVRSRAKRAPR